MESFFDSHHCLSAEHCHICRNPSADFWRAGLRQAFDIGNDINFQCPHGVAWIGPAPKKLLVQVAVRAPLTPAQPGDFAYLVIKCAAQKKTLSCRSCDELRVQMNKDGWWRCAIRLPDIAKRMRANRKRTGEKVTWGSLLRCVVAVALRDS